MRVDVGVIGGTGVAERLAALGGETVHVPTPSGLLKRPSFYAMRLYAHHAKPVPWQVESSTAGLDVFAGGSEDSKQAVVFAVNSRSEPVACSLDLGGWDGAARLVSAEALCDMLDARQPDVMNHWNAPDRVKIIALPPRKTRLSSRPCPPPPSNAKRPEHGEISGQVT